MLIQRKKELSLILLMSSFVGFMQAELPLTEVAGTSACMKSGYELYAPSLGCLYWKSNYTRNLLQYGLNTSGMVKLVKSLFFIQFDNVTFDITASPTKIAHYFSPSDIGKLIGTVIIYQTQRKDYLSQLRGYLIKAGRLTLKNKEGDVLSLLKEHSASLGTAMFQIRNTIALLLQKIPENERKELNQFKKKQRWEEILKKLEKFENIKIDRNFQLLGEQIKALKEIKYLQQKNENITKEFIDSINSILKEIVKSRNKEIKESIIKGLTSTIDRKEKELKTIKDKKVESLLKAIKQQNEKFLEEEKKASEGVKNPFLKTEVEKRFAKIVYEALSEEEQGLYSKGSVSGLFLAWLWKYSATKKDIESFLRSLSETLKEEVFDKELLYSAPYTKSYYKKSTELRVKKIIEEFISSNPHILHDGLLFTRYGYELYKAVLPNVVPMKDRVKSISQATFPDCGETSLRNFFNALLYDSLTGQFNIKILKNLKAKEALIKFYQVYTTPEYITSIAEGKNAYNDWAVVVSGLPNVEYAQEGGCEIKSGVYNMLAVIKNLLPGVDSFEDLEEKLKENDIGFDIEWDVKPEKGNDTNNNATITIEKPQQDPFSIEWRFQPYHFEMTYNISHSTAYFRRYRNAFNKSIPDVDMKMQWPYIMLDAAFGADIDKLIILYSQKVNASNIYLLADTRIAENKVKFAKGIVASSLESSLKASILLNMFAKLPEDRHIIDNFIDAIGVFFNQEVRIQGKKRPFGISLLRNATNDLQKYIVTNKLLYLKEHLSKEEIAALQNLPLIGNDLHLDIIKLLLDKLKIEKDKNIVKPLINLIEKMLSAIKDDSFKREIILKIMSLISLPEKEMNKENIKPLFTWVKDTLPILDNFRKQIMIGEIIDLLKQPETGLGKETIKTLFTWIKDTLPTLAIPVQRSLISNVLGLLKLPEKKIGQEDIKPLLKWLNEMLKNWGIESNSSIKAIIELMSLPATELNQENVKPLFAKFLDGLPEIKRSIDQVVIIISIIELLQLPATELNQENIKPLFEWLDKTLPEFTGKLSKKDIIISIIELLQLPATELNQENIKPLFEWLNSTLPKIERPRDQVDIIEQIIELLQLPATELNQKNIKPLLIWLDKTLSEIKEEEFKKDIIIRSLGLLGTKEWDQENIKPLSKWFYGTLPKMKDQLKSDVISKAVELIISRELSAESDKSLLKLIYETLLTIKTTSVKKDIIPNVINLLTQLPSNRRHQEYIKLLLEWINDTLPKMKSSFIKSLIKITFEQLSQLPANELNQEGITTLLKLIYERLLTIKKTLIKKDIIQDVIKWAIELLKNKQNLEYITPLLKWVNDTLGEMKSDSSKKVIIEEAIKLFGFPEKEQNQENIKPLIEWVENTLPKIKSVTFKEKIIKEAIELLNLQENVSDQKKPEFLIKLVKDTL